MRSESCRARPSVCISFARGMATRRRHCCRAALTKSSGCECTRNCWRKMPILGRSPGPRS
eukprot:scaffold1954_cov268-Pinguiococcus_pyrenoidosus.AAC.120